MTTPEGITGAAGSPVAVAAVLQRVADGAGAQAGGENFPVALRVVPRAPRRQLLDAYTYARFVDDVGDRAPGDRPALLDEIEHQLRMLPDGQPDLQVIAALAPIVRSGGITVDTLMDLVQANRLDQTATSYETFADLVGYCRFSANPVGRIVLAVADAATDQNKADSDAVCTALQVLEHCQDVGEDARAGRVYLPQHDLRHAGVQPGELLAARTSPALRSVVLQQVDRAADLLDAGRPLVGRLHGWARLAVAGYVAGGDATVRALYRAAGEVLAAPVRPSPLVTATRAVRMVTGTVAS
jgi:squalene synthase HpnC